MDSRNLTNSSPSSFANFFRLLMLSSLESSSILRMDMFVSNTNFFALSTNRSLGKNESINMTNLNVCIIINIKTYNLGSSSDEASVPTLSNLIPIDLTNRNAKKLKFQHINIWDKFGDLTYHIF